MLTNLTKIRKSRGLRQYEVAKYLNIDRASYSNYETGKRDPDTDTVVKLANLFDVTTDYLLGNSDDSTPPFKAPETFYTVPMEPSPQKDKVPISDEDLKFALFGRTDVDDKALNAVKKFARYVDDEEDD